MTPKSNPALKSITKSYKSAKLKISYGPIMRVQYTVSLEIRILCICTNYCISITKMWNKIDSTSECTTWRHRSDAVRSSWIVVANVQSGHTFGGPKVYAGSSSWLTRASRRTPVARRRSPKRVAVRLTERKLLATGLGSRELKLRFNRTIIWRTILWCHY